MLSKKDEKSHVAAIMHSAHCGINNRNKEYIHEYFNG